MKIPYILFFIILFSAFGFTNKPTMPRLGIVADLSKDSIAFVSGFRMIGESVGRVLSPAIDDQGFEKNLQKIKNAKCKVVTCNLFFPANLKIAGPDVDQEKVLTYAETVLSRAKRAGVKIIVLGSGGARNIPVGYDLASAKTNFIALSRKLGQTASKYGVVIALENLETTETNFITSLNEAAEIVSAVNHPNFRLNIDIFHMMRQNEPESDILAVGKIAALAELAEVEKRTLPGVKGDDFKPYLKSLRAINYKGYIFMEASTKNAAVEFPQAFKYLTKQLADVYAD